MMSLLASFKAVVDKYDPANISDGSTAFTEILNAFDTLICDESYYSSIMRKFSVLIRTAIFFNKSKDSKILTQVHTVNNKNFKSIFFANFGRVNDPTLYDLLSSVLEVYRKDTDYLEALVIDVQEEMKSSLDSHRKGRDPPDAIQGNNAQG